MYAIVPIIFIIVLLAAVTGRVTPKQVFLFLLFLMLGPMLISIALNTGKDTFIALPLWVQSVIVVTSICLLLRWAFPGAAWWVFLRFILLLPLRLVGSIVQLILYIALAGLRRNRRRPQRPRINY